MKVSNLAGTLKRLRKTPWRYQQTFLTPLQDLPPFVATILSGRKQIENGTVTIDAVVFEQKNLNALLSSKSVPPVQERGTSMEAEGQEETKMLLEAALGDWVDFWFVPTPKPFVIYADHDEYITFFANTKSNLNGVVELLLNQGFQKVEYERHW